MNNLGCKRCVLAECGHGSRAFRWEAPNYLEKEMLFDVDTSVELLAEYIREGKITVDAQKNQERVTLHDPCNMVRLMGIVRPQREILEAIMPPGRFREMTPHGVDNYCCGGGSGFAVGNSVNFPDWRTRVAGRMKFRQILNAFSDSIGPETNKYVCAPCSNCKGQLRDIIRYYEGWDRCRILYGGLVELIVNAMVDVPEGFLEWEFH